MRSRSLLTLATRRPSLQLGRSVALSASNARILRAWIRPLATQTPLGSGSTSQSSAIPVRRSSSMAVAERDPARAASIATADPFSSFTDVPIPIPSEPTLALSDWSKHAYTIRPRPTIEQPFLVRYDPIVGTKESDAEIVERAFISDSDVDQWIENYKIPESELAKCHTEQDAKDLRRLYARQLRLECSVYEMAIEKRMNAMETVNKLGRLSSTTAAKSLIVDWMGPATDRMVAEQRRIRECYFVMDANVYGPAFLMLDGPVLAAIGLNTVINHTMMESRGAFFVKLALELGRKVQDEIFIRKKKRAATYLIQSMAQLNTEAMRLRMQEMFDAVGEWDLRTLLKIGCAVIDCLQQSCFVPDRMLRHQPNVPGVEQPKVPAFGHDYVFDHSHRRGVITVDERIRDTVLSVRPNVNILPWTARYLPMLVPPKPWTGITGGGYLRLFTKILRHRDTMWQMECVRRANLDRVLKPLNLLSQVPWVINKDVLHVMLQLWEEGGGFGGLPPRQDVPMPEWREEYMHDEDKRRHYEMAVAKAQQHNHELHSMRCDTVYKLQVAQEFKDEKEMYYPYSMDFRGRVYPIPPNLNHLGADLSRSLLVFRDHKPLGKHGLRWLKIHLANVFGIDKCSFDDRANFTESHFDKVLASARNPLGTGDCAWWRDADYPFLALGVCFELRRAYESPDPEAYMSNLPVHQDGSCNGLQHYAALARDHVGGGQVNLVPGARPADVYSGVAAKVIDRIEQDAAIEVPDDLPNVEAFDDKDSKEDRKRKQLIVDLWKKKRRKENARMLQGTISRKVVKQTVMTSVYGVTYVGARKQIQARLEEVFIARGDVMDNEMEKRVYRASCYAAEITMDSMGDLFTSARAVMAWLADCAAKVAESGQAMSWMTPLGLPVAQPYRRKERQELRTKLQHVILMHSDQLPVSNSRQKSAFPPNFVHSLDSTHMLMTAQKCIEEDHMAFAAVHDSYWTHACNVDLMNQRLREKFVELYEQPLLETLRDHLHMRFPKTQFPEMPRLGDLDLRVVLDSPYFFN